MYTRYDIRIKTLVLTISIMGFQGSKGFNMTSVKKIVISSYSDIYKLQSMGCLIKGLRFITR